MDDGKEHPWKKTNLRADTITDIAYDDGKLYVAGLSNEEFSSALRIVPFPFGEKATARISYCCDLE